MKELLMGNEAMALGALIANVRCVCGYPGTPSSEVLETVARRNPGRVYVEWSVNEKVGMELAAGAAYAGARTLVTMKQVGLNVASDPLMCVNYIGIKGGLVILAADDPGPISSQTEQDTRAFAKYARIPVLDPATPLEAFQMMQEAFALSERYGTPVLLRPTTRVCHACEGMEVPSLTPSERTGEFVKDPRWVIFPKLSYQSKQRLCQREAPMADELSNSWMNRLSGRGHQGIICGGAAAAVVSDVLRAHGEQNVRVFRVGTPYPFPALMALEFLSGVTDVLALEELEPVLEEALTLLCGQKGLAVRVHGKHTGESILAGELSYETAERCLAAFLGWTLADQPSASLTPPPPVRPPVLCAGCPHRASFYAVKRAMHGKRAVYCGDIGCYTLGNALPLDMVDTCLCMGAGLNIAQGLSRAGDPGVHFGFIGDSTFFHSGLTGVVNALYNRADVVFIILDNRTTAMTGQQPHPGTGRTMMGEAFTGLSIENTLRGLGVPSIRRVDPLDLDAAMQAVSDAAAEQGVRAIIFESPCVSLARGQNPSPMTVTGCKGCRRCVSELGCPALAMRDGLAVIDPTLCNSCGLCAKVCPFGAIGKGDAR